MEIIMEYLPFLIPLFVIQLGLMIAALVHIFRHNTYKSGTRVLWVIISICVNILGPILYFVIGKGDD